MIRTADQGKVPCSEEVTATMQLSWGTTGGIAASFASLGNIILAEPKALIGFAGPKVIA